MINGETESGGSELWVVIVSVGAFIVNVVAMVSTAVWTLGRSRSDIDDKIAMKDRAVTDDLIELERRVGDGIIEATKQFGESLAAVRAKITEVEIWNRDNFVSKRTFDVVIDEIRRSWERFEDRLNERLDRIDKKLDQKN